MDGVAGRSRDAGGRADGWRRQQPERIAIGNGAVWVANSLDGTVSRIDPNTNAVVQTIPVGNGPSGIIYTAGSIWVANTGDRTVTKIDADSGKPETTLPIGRRARLRAGTLWASERTANRVVRIDPKSGAVVQTRFRSATASTGLAFGGGVVWVANSLDGTVSRIDPTTNSVTGTIATGNGPAGVAVAADGVWVSNQFGGTVARIDPRTNQVVRRISVGNRPLGVAVSGDSVLVSVLQSGAGHRGGTLTVRMNRALDSIDSAVAYDTTSLPILRMTNDGLVAYDQASGLAGTQLVPDLAVSLPSPTDSGRTYTFRLRRAPAIRTADRYERPTFVPRSSALNASCPSQLQRASSVPRAAKIPQPTLARIITDDGARTVTFHLVAPDPSS